MTKHRYSRINSMILLTMILMIKLISTPAQISHNIINRNYTSPRKLFIYCNSNVNSSISISMHHRRVYLCKVTVPVMLFVPRIVSHGQVSKGVNNF